jgi:hypothetical protein
LGNTVLRRSSEVGGDEVTEGFALGSGWLLFLSLLVLLAYFLLRSPR